jgi:hypothetical protein
MTREEDTANCLLGLVDVNMPFSTLMSFLRLQEELLRRKEDPSVLLWSTSIPVSASRISDTFGGFLTASPADYRDVHIRVDSTGEECIFRNWGRI